MGSEEEECPPEEPDAGYDRVGRLALYSYFHLLSLHLCNSLYGKQSILQLEKQAGKACVIRLYLVMVGLGF